MQRLEKQLAVLNLTDAWDQLPQSLSSIPEQILESTGIKLEILHKDQCVAPLFDIERAVAAFEIYGDQQRVVIWCDPLTATSSVLGHELVHLRRDICEAQIKLMPTQYTHPNMRSFVHQLENEIEHIFIIPEEIESFTDAEARWAEDYAEVINRIMT